MIFLRRGHQLLKSYYLANILPKTAWKWKNLDLRGLVLLMYLPDLVFKIFFEYIGSFYGTTGPPVLDSWRLFSVSHRGHIPQHWSVDSLDLIFNIPLSLISL